MSPRLVVLLMITSLLVAPSAARAQRPGKLPRIGILSQTSPPPPSSPQVEYLVQGKALGLTLPQSLLLRADQVIQ